MELLFGLERVEVLLRAAQLVEKEGILFVGEIDDECLLLACIRGCMQRDLDIQILSEIFAVLRSETNCNLTFMEGLIELELIRLLGLVACGADLVVRQQRRQGLWLMHLRLLAHTTCWYLLGLAKVVDTGEV